MCHCVKELVTAQLKVQNLQLGLLRIAVRHAVAGENEGKTHPIPSHHITQVRIFIHLCDNVHLLPISLQK